jgi:hypothetical protein
LALLYLVGTAVAGQNLGTKIITACAILAIFPAVYLWKLITTPAKLDAEATIETNALKQELDGRQSKREIRLALGNLMDEGQSLMRAIQNSSMRGMPVEYQSWCEKAEAYLRGLDESLVPRFRDESGFPADFPSGMFVANAAHYLGVKARVGRLNQFIEQYLG